MLFRRDPVEHAFRRFVRNGDAAALGEVFDATAAELLRIALWLCGDRTDAEDLLQRTFLTALESRDRFDVSRRVLPWLCGILANHVRGLKRERKRPGVALGNVDASHDPQALAADREIAQRITDLRGTIDPPYREVLDLHLGDGLGPKEIAERLQRKEGTVRTQLMRGLELLRRALPSQAALGLLPLTANLRQLAPLRSKILALARVPPTKVAMATAATATPVLLLMTKKLIPMLAVLLVGLGIAIYATSDRTQSPSRIDSSLEPRTDQAVAGPAVDAKEDAERRPVDSTMPTATADLDDRARLRVFLHWSDDLSPAAGVAVLVEFASMSSAATSRDAVSDRRGEAELDELIPGEWLVRTSHGGSTQRVTLTAGATGEVMLSPSRTATLTGVVVDAAGRPVADATILLSAATSGPTAACALSDGEGKFTVPVYGEHMISARKTGYCASYETPVSGANPSPLRLALRPLGGRLTGVVRDATGQPIVRANVLVGPDRLSYLARAAADPSLCMPRGTRVVTDEAGRFDVDGVEPGRCDVRAWNAGFAPWHGEVLVSVGATSAIDVALEPGARLAGTVFDAEGSPVQNATVRFGTPGAFAAGSTKTGGDGSYALDSLPAGAMSVIARKESMESAANLTLVGGVVTTWDPHLAARQSIEGTVLRADGSPFAEVSVGCFPEGQFGPAEATSTDAQGHFRLEDVGNELLTVQVTMNGHDAWISVKDVRPGTADLVIRVDARAMPTAYVTGRVIDTSLHPVRGHAMALRDGADHCSLVPFDSDSGEFRIGPMPAGTYHLSVTTDELGKRTLGKIDLDIEATYALGDIVMEPPGRATFAISADEIGLVTRGSVTLYTPDGEWSVRADIQRGSAEIEHLAPGRYLVIADSMNASIGADLAVQSAGTSHADLHLVHAARTKICFVDPRPADPGRSVMVFAYRADGSFAGLSGTWRREGPLESAMGLPPGRYRVECRVSDGRHTTAEVEITVGPSQVEIRLPR